MIKFTDLLKRAETEEIVIHTPTEEQAKTLLKTLNEKGFMWAGGERLPDISYYEDFGQDTCYVFGCYNLLDSSKKVRYCALDFYQDHGYTVIECGDIDLPEKGEISMNNELEALEALEKLNHTICLNSPTIKWGIDIYEHIDCKDEEEFVKCYNIIRKALKRNKPKKDKISYKEN